MDTRAPPIAPRTQDRRCQQQQQQQQHHQEEVTLPPLAPTTCPTTQRQRNKHNSSAPAWRSNASNPTQSHEFLPKQRRPYKVLGIGATPLMHACQQADRARVLKLLREQEETIGYRDRALRSALHYCMDASTGGAVAQAAPELVNSPDAEGHTPLHLAVIAGDHQLVAVLLASGADVNAKDLEGHSVLHWATVCGEVECARLVLAAGARPSSPDLRGGSPLHYAAQCCGAAATAELAVPKKVGLKVLQTLLEFGADVNARDEDGRQPILWAASAGSVEAVLALVRAGGSAVAGASDKDGLTALHCAASRGHARCIEALVTLCDAQPDHVDDNGCSALHYAATLGHADATSLLLKLGADPNRQDRKGRTPALCAAAKGQLETLKILAQHGGSLHARTLRGTGVAHEAVASGRLELVKWLAKRRSSLLDVATPDGKTPLHVAALHGHLDACKLLLDSGARVNALLRTSKGGLMTALDAALYRGHRDCAKLIQLHGGATAQHLKSQHHKPGASTKVNISLFSSKPRTKHLDATSSDSELNDASPRRHHHHNHQQHQSQSRRRHRGGGGGKDDHHSGDDTYYEERWIERRTRRRANRRRLSRQDSRSFSEEELRHHSKAVTGSRAATQQQNEQRHHQRRALSENARYEEDVVGVGPELAGSDVEDEVLVKGAGSRGRRRSEKRRSRHARSAGNSEDEGEGEEESSSVSDDSLEVVVVRRSLERTTEKIVSSGRKSRTPRDAKDSARSAKSQDSSRGKGEGDVDKSEKQKQQQTFDGDSTSQDTVERVTIEADVHKNAAPDSSRSKQAEREADEQQQLEQQQQSKMDEILGKADELQSALLSKAADLKKDVEEMRQQMSSAGQKAEAEAEKEQQQQPKDEKGDGEQQKEGPKEGQKEVQEKVEETREEVVEPPIVKEVAEEKPAKQETESTEKRQEERSEADKTTEDKTASPEKEKKTEKKKVEGTTEEKDKEKDEEQAKEGMAPLAAAEVYIPGTESFRFADESSSSSPGPGRQQQQQKQQQQKLQRGSSRPTTGKRRANRGAASTTSHLESSEERSPDRSAIVAVIESPEWDEEDEEDEDDLLDREIREAVGGGDGDGGELDEEEEDDEEGSDGIAGEDDDVGIVRVLPSTSEEETGARTSAVDSLPQLQTSKSQSRLVRLASPRSQSQHQHLEPLAGRTRRDSGGRDSGIEPSPRVSRIPRRAHKCCPNSERQRSMHLETVTRDVQISMRRYYLERKIFFQLMELKRLQIRQGRANEQILVKRLVEAFNKSGMSGPTLGVAKYDRPYTFRHFEMFLYEQLRKLQRRPATPDWCTEAKQCTQKTHRCHHATSAYTSVPIYTYLGGGVQERPSLLPRIEGRGRGQMTVEVTHGDEKQVIALPSEKLDHTKRYYVTFTVRGETTDSEKPRTPTNTSGTMVQRNTKSV